MRALNVFLSIFVSLLLAGLVFEVGLRLLGMGPQPTINRFDPELGWVKTPGAKAERETREFDVHYTINSLGLRDDEMSSPKKPDGTYRVLMLGDSFVLGYTVDRQDLFVDQLEKWWQSEGRKVDVINSGTEGYSTDQEVRWLDLHGKEYQPDLVLIFPYDNDLYWNSQYSYARFPKPRYDGFGRKEERPLVDPGQRSKWESFAIGNMIARVTAPHDPTWAPDEKPKLKLPMESASFFENAPDFMKPAYQYTDGSLIALRKICAGLGAELVMVPIPNKDSIQPEAKLELGKQLGSDPEHPEYDALWSPDHPVEQFLKMAQREGITAFDPRAALRKDFAQSGVPLYYQRDWHLNPAGNRALARFVHQSLDEAKIFPPAFAAARSTELPEPQKKSELPGWVVPYAILLAILSTMYALTYRDEAAWLAPLKIGGMLAVIFAIAIGGNHLLGLLPPQYAIKITLLFVLGVLGFVFYKLGRRLGTIAELFGAFVGRGHWYLMPLVVVLLSAGSLLVVAASSPLVAPFIYTLF
jgi:hypothetical protein